MPRGGMDAAADERLVELWVKPEVQTRVLERATTGFFFGLQRWRLSGDGLDDVATDRQIAQLRRNGRPDEAAPDIISR